MILTFIRLEAKTMSFCNGRFIINDIYKLISRKNTFNVLRVVYLNVNPEFSGDDEPDRRLFYFQFLL